MQAYGVDFLASSTRYTDGELAGFGWAPYHLGDPVDAAIVQADALTVRTLRVYCCQMWSIDASLIEDWVASLDGRSRAALFAALEVLRDRGPQLGRPLVDVVAGSRHRNMKELRPGSSGRSELRVLFAFDPARQAILLVAGDKAGSWNRWYTTNIPRADDLLDEHLRDLKG